MIRDGWDAAPGEIREVAERCLENAREAGLVRDGFSPVYFREDRLSPGTWLLGSQFEDGSGTVIRRRDGTWWYRPWMSEGPDLEYTRGQAMEDASIWWTG